MRVTKWGEYGILCALYLAEQEENKAIGAAEIASARAIPIQYAHQILRRLRQGDIIRSHRGPHGGYELSRPPAETNLRQVLEAAEGVTFEVICESHPVYETCQINEGNCALRPVWEDLQSSINKLLESRTLADILEKHKASITGGASQMVYGPTRKSSLTDHRDFDEIEGR